MRAGDDPVFPAICPDTLPRSCLCASIRPNGLSRSWFEIWAEIDETPYEAPRDQPLTFVAYSAGVPPTAYVQPMRVGDLLGEMPLFLTPDRYVEVPLETTYAAAWRGMPQRWRRELEP